jgi:hypothetical protein
LSGDVDTRFFLGSALSLLFAGALSYGDVVRGRNLRVHASAKPEGLGNVQGYVVVIRLGSVALTQASGPVAFEEIPKVKRILAISLDELEGHPSRLSGPPIFENKQKGLGPLFLGGTTAELMGFLRQSRDGIEGRIGEGPLPAHKGTALLFEVKELRRDVNSVVGGGKRRDSSLVEPAPERLKATTKHVV